MNVQYIYTQISCFDNEEDKKNGELQKLIKNERLLYIEEANARNELKEEEDQ